jgi:predicted MFS family arabinose efflux permease
LYTALAVGLGGGIGTLAAGSLCDMLRSRVDRIEIKMLILILTVSLPALLVVVLAGSQIVALGALFVFNVCAFAWTGPMASLIQDEASPESRSLAISVSLSVAAILSLGLGMPLVGLLSDSLSARFGPIGLGYAVACAASAVGALGLIAYLRVLMSFRAEQRRGG